MVRAKAADPAAVTNVVGIAELADLPAKSIVCRLAIRELTRSKDLVPRRFLKKLAIVDGDRPFGHVCRSRNDRAGGEWLRWLVQCRLLPVSTHEIVTSGRILDPQPACVDNGRCHSEGLE